MATANAIISGALSRQPENQNLLSPLNFQFGIQRMPGVNWFIQSVNIPGITLGETIQPSQLIDTPLPGEKLTYDPLSITFKVDEDLRNWTELQTWLVELGTPESFKQYNAQMSDGTLIVENSLNNPNFEVIFHEMWISSVGELQFDTTQTDVDYITATATFRFRNYVFQRV